MNVAAGDGFARAAGPGSSSSARRPMPAAALAPSRRATRLSERTRACINHAPIPGSFALQAHHGEVQSQQSPVPPSAYRLLFAAGIGVVVELRAHINRRLVRKAIFSRSAVTVDRSSATLQGSAKTTAGSAGHRARRTTSANPGAADVGYSQVGGARHRRAVPEFVVAPFDAVIHPSTTISLRVVVMTANRP